MCTIHIQVRDMCLWGGDVARTERGAVYNMWVRWAREKKPQSQRCCKKRGRWVEESQWNFSCTFILARNIHTYPTLRSSSSFSLLENTRTCRERSSGLLHTRILGGTNQDCRYLISEISCNCTVRWAYACMQASMCACRVGKQSNRCLSKREPEGNMRVKRRERNIKRGKKKALLLQLYFKNTHKLRFFVCLTAAKTVLRWRHGVGSRWSFFLRAHGQK